MKLTKEEAKAIKLEQKLEDTKKILSKASCTNKKREITARKVDREKARRAREEMEDKLEVEDDILMEEDKHRFLDGYLSNEVMSSEILEQVRDWEEREFQVLERVLVNGEFGAKDENMHLIICVTDNIQVTGTVAVWIEISRSGKVKLLK